MEMAALSRNWHGSHLERERVSLGMRESQEEGKDRPTNDMNNNIIQGRKHGWRFAVKVLNVCRKYWLKRFKIKASFYPIIYQSDSTFVTFFKSRGKKAMTRREKYIYFFRKG